MANNWSKLFINAVQSILDAFSHVDEFDSNTFMSSMFVSTPDRFNDINAKIASEHARVFIRKANTFIQSMLNFHPEDAESNTPMSWWTEDRYYDLACSLLNQLQLWTDVVPSLQRSIDALSGVYYKPARVVLLTFKKECIEVLNGLNKVIEAYNRVVAVRFPNYSLVPIVFSE